MSIQKYLIDVNDSIMNALIRIEKNHKRSLVGIDRNKVYGTISDGDIRRAIINDVLLSASLKNITNKGFIHVEENLYTHEDIELLFNEFDIQIIPVLTSDMDIAGIHTKEKCYKV